MHQTIINYCGQNLHTIQKLNAQKSSSQDKQLMYRKLSIYRQYQTLYSEQFKKTMGGTQSKSDETFRATEWQQAHDIELPNQCIGQYIVVRNRITGELLDRYTLQFPNAQDYNKYLESISYRRNQPNVVRVMHYQPKVVKQFCGSVYMLNVYLEHCRSRLVQYEDIPFPDYLYCAMAMLDGYNKLHRKVGRFFVSEQQVMIDEDGQIRVWLNSDYSQNQAEDFTNEHYGSSNANEQQYQMVKDVMEMVFSNSDQSEGPAIKFVDFYERQKHGFNGRVGFQQAKSITLDYTKVNNIQVPEIFKSVYDIYQAQQPHRNNDALSFKNGLFDPDHTQQEPVRGRLSSGQGYQQLQSGLTNTSQTNRNISLQSTTVPHNILQNTGYGPIGASGLINPISLNHHLPQPHPQPQSSYMQHSRSGGLQQPIQNNYVSRPVYQSPPHQGRPFFQQSPIQAYPQPQFVQTPRQGQFPIVIKPVPGVNNLPNMPVSHSPNHFSNYQPPRPIHFQPQPQPQPQLQPAQIPINTRPFPPQQYQPTFIPNNTFIKPIQNYNQTDRSNNRSQNEYDEAEIQRKLLSNQHNIYHEDINQANVIRDLAELHKIQQQQRSKRSINQDSSRNYHRNYDQEDGRYNDHQSDRQIDQQDKGEHVLNGEYDQHDYQEEQSDHHQQNSSNNYNTRVQQVQVQTYQPLSQNNQNISPFPNNQLTTQQQYYISTNKSPIKHQVSQPQYYSAFNQQVNGGLSYNSLQLNQANSVLNQSSQANIIKGQINQMSINLANIENQEILKKSQSMGNSKKQFYYTLSNQIQLDPEIAADLALFVNG